MNKNIIVVPDFPQEYGDDTLTFVDCGTGKILKVVNLTDLYLSRDVLRRDPIIVEVVGYYKKLSDSVKKEDYIRTLRYPEEVHLRVEEGDFCKVYSDKECKQMFYLGVGEYIITNMWLVSFRMENIFGETKDEADEYFGDFPFNRRKNIWKVRAERVEWTEPTYHKDEDTFWENAQKQGIDVSDVQTREDRKAIANDWRLIARRVAKQNNWNILSILWHDEDEVTS